ncbi:MAG: head GIN domain-containing protein [bacterium]|nr:head GIN domain-containing protein [bacterium]
MNNKGIVSIVGLILVIVALFAAVVYLTGRGSGNVVSEERKLGEFSRIALNGVGNITVTQGEQVSLAVEAEDNIIGKISTEVEGDTLKINYNRSWWLWTFWPTKDINFAVTVTELDSVSISGSGSLSSSNLNSDDFEISISGSGDVNLFLRAETLTSTISGSGDFALSGEVGSQILKINGSGEYLAQELSSREASIDINGSGTAEVWAEDTLEVDISGSGTVRYLGNPQVSQSISGSGDIEKFGDAPAKDTELPSEAYADTRYCEKDNDCLAVEHPSNICYKAYYNIYAEDEIETYQNQTDAIVQDCPYFGPAVCRDNTCQGAPAE